MKRLICAACFAMMALPAVAQDGGESWVAFGPMEEGPVWGLGVSRTQWVDSRLPLLPKNALTGGLRFRDAYATTFALTRTLGTVDVGVPDTRFRLRGMVLEAEGTLSVHDGAQDHVEGTLGVMARTPAWEVGDVGAVRLGWANGLSYAFGDPALERGASGRRGVDPERLQYYMGFEASFAPAAVPNMEIFGRLHHRSGIYGVISPSSTGSNTLGGGLRFNF